MGKVRFDKIARECRETFKGSFTNMPIVGLEHIEPYDMKLKNYEVNVETTFTKQFHKGQILFGRRRAYQHKACVATFDGICSGDITVIEPIEGQVYPNLLPFIVQNDDFFEHAIKGSNGALSPRVKWEHMENFEFSLPSLAEQKVLAEKLWAAYEVKQSYLKMIAATEEMVKAQFIEMFGEVSEKSPILNDVAEIYDGTHKTPSYTDSGIPFISVENIDNLYGSNKYISENDYLLYKHKPEFGDVFMTRIGSIGKCAVYESSEPLAYYVSLALIKPNRKVIQSKFLKYYIESNDGVRELKQRSLLRAFPMKINLGEIGKIKVVVPPIAEQIDFVEIAEQADKSISELRKSVDAIDKVIKSLINENL